MDGIANVLGGNTVRLEFRGRVFTLSTMTLHEYAEREAYILSRRPVRPLVCSAVPKEKTPKRRVGQQESDLFQQSPHGLGWRLWRALRKHHPEFHGIDEALALIDQATPAELATIREKIELSEEADLLADVYMSGGGDNESDGGRIPWAAIARNLSTRYGWLPEQIGGLTLYQALAYSGGFVPEDGRRLIDDKDIADFQSWQARRELAGVA